jgi:hypothetical protein
VVIGVGNRGCGYRGGETGCGCRGGKQRVWL